FLCRERLEVGPVGFAVSDIAEAHEEVDSAIMIHRTQHAVEIHRSVKETPRHIAHQRPQERINRHQMPPERIVDVRKVLVALETKLSDRENLIAEVPAGLGCRDLINSCCAHLLLLPSCYAVWQISAQRSIV